MGSPSWFGGVERSSRLTLPCGCGFPIDSVSFDWKDLDGVSILVAWNGVPG